jgi:2-deoxy-scyllo-inosamine dehydrogenase (SAM-dependent)
MKPEPSQEKKTETAAASVDPWLRLNHWFMRARDRAAGLFPFLLRTGAIRAVAIETTTECTRKCSYCPPHHSLAIPPLRMEPGLYAKILASLAAHNYAGGIFFNLYGESLRDDRLEAWVRDARSRLPAAELTVFTNGDLLTYDRYLSLKEAGMDMLVVSLHSEGGRGPLLGTLERLRRDKPELYTVRVMDYYRLYHTEGNRLSLLNNKGGLTDVKRRPFRRCYEAENTAIDCLGNVLLCCNDCTASYVFGNVAERDLYDIWNAPAFAFIRNSLLRGQWPFEICRKCMSAGGLCTALPAGAAARLPAAFTDFSKALTALGFPPEKLAPK